MTDVEFFHPLNNFQLVTKDSARSSNLARGSIALSLFETQVRFQPE